MDNNLIDGKKAADKVLAEAASNVGKLPGKPNLAIVLVGDDPASQLYTKKKGETCKKVGIDSQIIRMPSSSTQSKIIEQVNRLNTNPNIDGILVQVPLPNGIDEDAVLSAVHPEKDVDGFQPENFGKLALNLPTISPCTPKGIIHLLKLSGVSLPGKHAIVIGRSRIVGKPLALLLLNEGCTVTICHSKTRDICSISRQGDIVCVAVGKPRFLKADMVKEGAIVVDAGTNREGEKLVGDVDFDPVSKKASLITPVPGGVGPMTVAMLIVNTIECFVRRRAKG